MTFGGITADSGFLVGVERSKQRALLPLKVAIAGKLRISVPVAVVAEWWRGGPRQAQILKAFEVAPMTERIARSAGEAIAAVPGATVVDAIVMASAAARGGVVYTSDFDDWAAGRRACARLSQPASRGWKGAKPRATKPHRPGRHRHSWAAARASAANRRAELEERSCRR
jgi:hypothetical protein